MNATLHGYLQNNGYVNTTCGFRYGNSSGSYGNNITNGIVSNKTEFSNGTTGLIPGQIYFYQAWASNAVGFANGSELTFLTKPNATLGLNAQANSSSVIYLTWSKGDGANNTYIERNASGDTVWARGTGTLVYNDTGTSCEDTGLSGGITYYYQAWSYTNWTYNPTLHQWSDENASASNTTQHAPQLSNPDPSDGESGVSINKVNVSVTINDGDGDTMNWTIEVNNSDNNSGSSGNGTINCTLTTPLANNITYTWWVNVTDGTNWQNATRLSSILHAQQCMDILIAIVYKHPSIVTGIMLP